MNYYVGKKKISRIKNVASPKYALGRTLLPPTPPNLMQTPMTLTLNICKARALLEATTPNT